jgi:signal transduction histidine kinase
MARQGAAGPPRWALGGRATAGFGLALLLVAVVCGLSYAELARFEAADEWVLPTPTVLGELEALSAALGEAEAEQRGYLLTGAEGHRQAFQAAANRAVGRLACLRVLTADNPGQQERLTALAPLVAGRLGALDDLAQGWKAGAAPPPGLAAHVEEGSRLAGRVRSLVRQMRDEEERLLRARSADAEARSFRTHAALAAAATGALVVLLPAVLLLNRGLLRRRRAEAERRVEERTAVASTDAEPRAAAAGHEQTGAELRRSEELFLHAQKLEVVGRLVGGVAHDFNNLLTVILSYGEMLRGRLADAEDRGMVEEITRAVGQAVALTRQLLDFGRKGVVQPRVLDLGASVAQTQKMLHSLTGAGVELAVVCPPGPVPVRVGPGQLEQVLLNLAINARDAMPHGGRLTVEVQVVELDGAYAAAHPGARPGAHALLAVSDTGVGMDAATRARAFEPFFTTKGEKGTGLGLATVHGIVAQAGGRVAVYSEPGRGATFKVYLPLAPAGAEAAEARVPAGPPPRGTETVLLAEDEGAVRWLARAALEGHGYTVLEADDGQQALHLAGRHAGPIHLLVTDLVMPGADGREVAERLRAQRPGLKVLYLSGYADDAVVHHGLLGAEADFLQKPFTPEALARKAREALDRP